MTTNRVRRAKLREGVSYVEAGKYEEVSAQLAEALRFIKSIPAESLTDSQCIEADRILSAALRRSASDQQGAAHE